MPIWQLCANLLIPNCLRSNLSYSPLAALELYVKLDKSKSYTVDITGVKEDKSAGADVALHGIWFNVGVSNGISNISVDSAKAGKTYNLAGQQVSDSYKGLVIKNGKKYVK